MVVEVIVAMCPAGLAFDRTSRHEDATFSCSWSTIAVYFSVQQYTDYTNGFIPLALLYCLTP